jgi:ligand-binding sensor domain-containing protein
MILQIKIPYKQPIIILVSVFLFFSLQLHAQREAYIPVDWLNSENYKLEPGLSQNDVTCILQDHKGYLWFGTWDGLNQYDGYNFKIYKPNIKNFDKGISHQSINALCEDHKNRIWIGTDGGINILEKGPQKFSHINSSDPELNISNDTIQSIVEDQYHKVWIGTNFGLNQYFPKENKIVSYFHVPGKKSSLAGNQIQQVFINDEEQVIVATNNGISVLNRKKGQFHSLKDKNNRNPLAGIQVNQIIQDKKSNYWIASEEGLFFYNKKQRVFKQYIVDESNGLTSNSLTSIMEDSQGDIWIGTNGNGICIYNPATAQFKESSHPIIKEFENDYIHSLFEDRSKIVYVGTSWRGLAKINPYANQFEHIRYSPNNPDGLNSENVWTIYENETDNVLWIGTNKGINLLDLETNTFSYMQHEAGNPNSLSDNLIRDIYQDEKGNYWISTYTGGLNHYNPETKSFRHYLNNPHDTNSISSDHVWKVYIDHSGNVWVGTNFGLNKFDPVTQTFKRYFNDPLDPKSISNNTIFSIFEDSKGKVYFCTYDGLNIYNPKQDNFSRIGFSPDGKGLSTKSVFSVYEDKEGILWIASMGGGLNKYDPRKGSFVYYTEDEGLPNNIVYRLFEDVRGNLWMSTNRGISRFNKETETFVNFDLNDGIQSYEYNHNAGYQNSKGVIYLGGMNGFNRFKPSNILKNDNLPVMAISSFNIFHEKQPIELSDGDTIILSYHQNFFSFEFSSLEFSNPQKNQYQYRLKNYNKAWIKTDANRRIAEYTKVKPGHYVFQVKGSNSDGIWSETPFNIVVIVKPLWWQRWLIRIPVLLLILLTIYIMISIRIRQIQQRHKTENEMLQIQKQFSDIQQKALRLQMNPHFIFNSLNSIQQFVLQQDSETAHIYLTNFSSLMRKILENSKHDRIGLNEEIESILLYLQLEELRFTEHFSYSIDIEKKLNSSTIKVPPMLIQPYLENAIWHGLMPKKSGGELKIQFRLSDQNTLEVCITDNGIGRVKAAEISSKRRFHKSTGMKNIEERLALMNSLNKTNMKVEVTDLYNNNKEAIGTEVKLFIHIDSK